MSGHEQPGIAPPNHIKHCGVISSRANGFWRSIINAPALFANCSEQIGTHTSTGLGISFECVARIVLIEFGSMPK